MDKILSPCYWYGLALIPQTNNYVLSKFQVELVIHSKASPVVPYLRMDKGFLRTLLNGYNYIYMLSINFKNLKKFIMIGQRLTLQAF